MKEKNNYKKFIPEDEEIRCGFKVSSNRKKVRNVELGLLEELKKICEKHNIKYYADGGTLLGAIRHGGFIPWDDDIDIVMFRKDYEEFLERAKNELPNYMKLWENHLGFSRLTNMNTTVLGDDNRRDKNFIGGICIDIFPIDYASKIRIVNRIKFQILRLLRVIMSTQKSSGSVDRLEKWKKFLICPFKFLFKKVDYLRIHNIHENVSKKVLFKGKEIYSAGVPGRFYSKSTYDNSHNVNFENTTICVPNLYDIYLKKAYGDYMKPVIYEGGHNCRYSVEKSYKDIIKSFDKRKSNKDNYNNCKDLFIL